MNEPQSPGDGKDTREKLLDTAERLFAAQGFDATSLRQITTEAGANLAAVNYHFGSKEDLIVEVLDRKMEPLNRQRIDLLDDLEVRHDRNPPLERIVEAFVGPPLRLKHGTGDEGNQFMRLVGHAMNDGNERLRQILTERFREVASRYGAAFSRALPHVPPAEVLWRMIFSVGSMVHSMQISTDHIKFVATDVEMDDLETTIARMVGFLTAGFAAPAASAPQAAQNAPAAQASGSSPQKGGAS
jgi:AcrR family transcriptional regulator